MSVPTITLNNGNAMPVIGLGTEGEPSKYLKKAVKHAINVGYRLIDCSYFDGNEVAIGRAINKKIRDGTVRRQDLFIVSKLWNTAHTREAVVLMCRKSLENLGLSYLDLYLIHWPFGFQEGSKDLLPRKHGELIASDVDYLDTWEGMEDCHEYGLTHSIGLSNFNQEQLDRIMLNARVYPVVNQVECHPYLNQSKLIEYCQAYGVVIMAYGPFQSPVIVPVSGSMRPTDIMVFRELQNKYKKSSLQLILGYLIQHGTVPIPKSLVSRQLEQNIRVFDFKLLPEDMQLMDSLNADARSFDFSEMRNHIYYPFSTEPKFE